MPIIFICQDEIISGEKKKKSFAATKQAQCVRKKSKAKIKN